MSFFNYLLDQICSAYLNFYQLNIYNIVLTYSFFLILIVGDAYVFLMGKTNFLSRHADD